MPQRPQLLEASKRSAAVGWSDAYFPQEAHAVGVDPDVAKGRETQAEAHRAIRERIARKGDGLRARSTCAKPAASVTTFTTLGSKNAAADSIGCAAVAMEASGLEASAAATSRIRRGSMRGSSPCTFTTISSAASPSSAAASARRSVPVSLRLGCLQTPATP